MNTHCIYIGLYITAALAPACASTPAVVANPDQNGGEVTNVEAPTYGELFDTYFAPGTAGHCATAGCHADPGHNVWLCGEDEATCYQGMVDVGLIDLANPKHSEIADPKRSPLTWINSAGGNMPLDAQGDNATARDAILAWVAAGAPRE